MAYKISRYMGGRDSEIADLILGVQNDEAGLSLTVEDQPDLLDIGSSYQGGGFWTAELDGTIVGTIGLLTYGKRGALKKFFVSKEHRGSAGPARSLFGRLILFARDLGLEEIFLDTPSVAERSHAFYRKAGFSPMDRAELPATYDFPDRNSLIFRLTL